MNTFKQYLCYTALLGFVLNVQISIFAQDQTTIWDAGEDLNPLSGGNQWPWSLWGAPQLANWKYFEGLGPIWQWKDTDGTLKSKWIYSYFHGWLYPVGDSLSSIWLYSIKYNKNWIWTGESHFDLFYIHSVASFYQYDFDSYGQRFLELASGKWYDYYEIPSLFHIDYSQFQQATPQNMVRIDQGQYFVGGNFPAEPFNDINDNGVYDFNEPFEDINGNHIYDSQFGYSDEYPSHRIDLSAFFVSKYEITNQLWDFIVDWSTKREDKIGDPNREFYKYEYDSLIYVNYDLITTWYNRMKVAELNYNQSPTQKNKDIWDNAIIRYEQQLENRNDKIEEILLYREQYPQNPVNYVSWFDVLKWCNAYSEYNGRQPVYFVDPGLGGVLRSSRQSRNDQNVFYEFNNGFAKWYANGYRLPTEAEWEISARGGLNGKEYGIGTGDFIDDTLANIDMDATLKPDPSPKTVGTYPANNYGIYNMSGNIQEWCWDWKAPYEDASASFILKVEPNIHSFKVSIPDLAEPVTDAGVAETVGHFLKLFNPASEVNVGSNNSKLTFTLPSSYGSVYFVIRNPDKNAQNILGIRDYDTSLKLTAQAVNVPSRSWSSPAKFTIRYTELETGHFGEHNVNISPPSSGILNASPQFAFAETINSALDTQNLDHLFRAVVINNKLAITYLRGNPPISFSVQSTGNDPFVTSLGFAANTDLGIDSSTLHFEAFNVIRIHNVARNPLGPESGDVRSFRGGFYEYPPFFSRVSLRNSHSPFLPTKKIGFRPVIGLPWDDR